MIAAIMQPYFFPYIGYFQLMRAVDVFVFYDDAQYMYGGWVNRNRISCNNRATWWTMPVKKDSHAKPINQRQYTLLDRDVAHRLERQLRASYAKSPHYPTVGPFIATIMESESRNVAAFNISTLTAVAERLGVRCRFLSASRMKSCQGLKGPDKVIELCHQVEADSYINPIGGVDLYNANSFNNSGIRLSFLRTLASPMELTTGAEHLSIIDGLMRHGFEGVSKQLDSYELLDAQ